MTDAVASDALIVNGGYPLSYFNLAGVDSIKYPDNFWWSSAERFATEDPTTGTYQTIAGGGLLTSEYLELDLGRIRGINYLNMDVMRLPVDISIQYDQLSAADGTHSWTSVSERDNMPFDKRLSYQADSRNAWAPCLYYFTDPNGDMVHTRFLRITFARRAEDWPARGSVSFRWAISVSNLRIGRSIQNLSDAAGDLLSTSIDATIVEQALPSDANAQSHEIRQQFVYPLDAMRVSNTPNMLGFGVLINNIGGVDTDESGIPVDLEWSLWDITTTPLQIGGGSKIGAVSRGKTWFDFYVPDDAPIAGATNKLYEFRVRSADIRSCASVFTTTANTLSQSSIPGNLTFAQGSPVIPTTVDTRSVVKIGSWVQKADQLDQVFLVNAVSSTTITVSTPWTGSTQVGCSGSVVYPLSTFDPLSSAFIATGNKCLVMRVWADIAAIGRDILGNSYRYATVRDSADRVFNNNKAGWMSAPQPAVDAVEALYFDVRQIDPLTTDNMMALIDAIRVAPRTPNVTMNVYYSLQNLKGDAPLVVDDWDQLLWTPVGPAYILRKDMIYEFPAPIHAAFIKLEFTNLVPMTFKIPSYPYLRPVQYRRFPTWVETQFLNSTVRRTVNDWFVQNQSSVQTKILAHLSDPVQEFAYKQRELLAALSLGQVSDSQVVNSGLIDVTQRAFIDPTTSSKIFLNTPNTFQNTLLMNVDRDSMLGRVVTQRYDPTTQGQSIELVPPTVPPSIPIVSTTADRIANSYSHLAQVPMNFNRTCRHSYRIEEAHFNRKAYFVGIDNITFLRNDYTIQHDDLIIQDILFDDQMLTENTWVREETSSIPDGSYIYISYTVGENAAYYERVFLNGDIEVPLSLTGGMVTNVFAYAGPNPNTAQFFQDWDFELHFSYDQRGSIINTISRSTLKARLTAPKKTLVFVDLSKVIGIGVLPQQPTLDSGTVSSTGVVSGLEAQNPPTFGQGSFGGGVFKALLYRFGWDLSAWDNSKWGS